MTTATVGAVLVGGASSRSDKATLDIAGAPLAARSIGALTGNGLDVVVGATGTAASLAGRAVADLWPGRAGRRRAHRAARGLPRRRHLGGGHGVRPSRRHRGGGATAARRRRGQTRRRGHVRRSALFPNGVWPVALLRVWRRPSARAPTRSPSCSKGLDVVEVDGGAAFADADEPGISRTSCSFGAHE
ncbi:MAG: hypothetical protein U0Q22_07630 [Acidimicrobiales bacterium]